MNRIELDRTAYIIKRKRKCVGAGKPDKYFYRTDWAGTMTRREYLDRLAETDPKECGRWLCYVEHRQMSEDRWWDCDGCRKEMLRQYRGKITAIRKKYGLTSTEVSRFMQVV